MNGNGVLLEWPEPIQRVQQLADSGIKTLPPRYIRRTQEEAPRPPALAPPIVDLSTLGADMQRRLSSACKEWGVFQVINHGIPHELLASAMAVSRSFFALPMEEKIKYANDPVTYQGYGSRMGVQKGIDLDWNDYFFHHLHPLPDSDQLKSKWPHQPPHYRRIIEQYGDKMVGLCKTLLSLFSEDLGQPKGCLLDCLGGDDLLGACFRMNYYPKCPQPQLALGLSPHSDPGAFTLVLQDQVEGLQVNKDGVWVTIPPVENAVVVLIADQLEILSNGIYKSVNHRTTVNGDRERMSLVVFCNPDGKKMVGPIESVVERSDRRRLYEDMSFNEYRLFIRTLGVQGKDILAKRSTLPSNLSKNSQ